MAIATIPRQSVMCAARQEGRAVTCRRPSLVLAVVVSAAIMLNCATARLDPERNQALTFDTVAAPDAGIAMQDEQMPIVTSRPSQLAPALDPQGEQAHRGFPDLVDAGSLICTVDPPDPKPLNTRDWVSYEFSYDQGAVTLVSTEIQHTARPRDSARVMGRYAVELWIGCELIDRVRFNFPLLAADPPMVSGGRHPLNEQPSLTARAHLTRTVRVPNSQRAMRAELVDRVKGTRSSLAWPPKGAPIGQ
jgi:hypothetical protein